MKKTLILCEGKWDLRLLSEYFENNKKHINFRQFSIEDVEEDNRGEESRVIREFNNPYYPSDYFIKSENGRNFFKRTYASSINNLMGSGYRVNLLLDLDHRNISEWVDEINTMCASRNYTKPTKTAIKEQIYDSKSICGHILEVIVGEEPKDEFRTVSFKTKMEEAAGIDKGQDNNSKKWKKVRKLSRDKDFQQAIERTYF